MIVEEVWLLDLRRVNIVALLADKRESLDWFLLVHGVPWSTDLSSCAFSQILPYVLGSRDILAFIFLNTYLFDLIFHSGDAIIL